MDLNLVDGMRHQITYEEYYFEYVSAQRFTNVVDFKYISKQIFMFYWEDLPETGNSNNKFRAFIWKSGWNSGHGIF